MRQPPTQPRCDLCGPEPPQCAARGWVACSPTTPLTLTEHERVSRRPPTVPGSFPKVGSPRQAVALRRAGRPGQPAAAACCCCCCTTHRCALPPGELSAVVEGWPGTSRVPLQRRRQRSVAGFQKNDVVVVKTLVPDYCSPSEITTMKPFPVIIFFVGFSGQASPFLFDRSVSACRCGAHAWYCWATIES